MRADRLLSIMLLLRSRGRVTAAALAERLEVSERTVLRDMEALSAAGVPVYAERGRGGGFSLVEGFRADVHSLDDAEAQVLFAYLGLDTFSELGLSREVGGVLDKLAAGAGRPGGAGRLREVVHVDRRGWFTERPDLAHLPDLRRAASERRRIRIGYRTPRDERPRQRTLDPLGLVEASGRWYLVGFRHGEPRTFRVDRISQVAVLDAPARIPADTALAEVWERTRSGFAARKPPDVEVRLLADPAAERDLRTVLEMQLADGGRLETVRRTPSEVELLGRFRLGFAVVGSCLAFGGSVEILEPTDLRARSHDAARAALARLTP